MQQLRQLGALALMLLASAIARAQDDVIIVGGDNGKGIFHVVVRRDSIGRAEGYELATVFGTLSVNDTVLGTTYENAALMIQAGQYAGIVRYNSPTAKSGGHAQLPFGVLGRTGDFLLEVADARADGDGSPKSNILFHGGIRPSDSKGCIMLGAVSRRSGLRFVKYGDPLRQLRLTFYGTDLPNESPNKRIVIDIIDVPGH